ncbi:MAG: gliding motility-associated C-terminal domain-containing protein [Bacteroidetes bacterium]|nr:gliding motility-associated C-terminal domain-containing protein [Bacteroidota bacterium]
MVIRKFIRYYLIAGCLAFTSSSLFAQFISGPVNVCPGSTPVYTVVGGTDAYNWSVPATWSINSGNGTTTITTTAGTVSGNIGAQNAYDLTWLWLAVNVYTTSSTAASISESANPICNGNSSTLTVNGGSLGSGASWQWYSGGCGGTWIGTGVSVVVSPSSTTSYYVRAEGTCNTTACVSTTITVNSLSTDPTGVNAVPGTICAGASTTLSVVGGSLGTGAGWYWYSGSCGGAFVGIGSPIIVSPGSTTNYYVRAQGTCNTTNCASATVTVNALSTAPASITASSNPICNGNSTTLTVNGGSLGFGASWQWYSGGCGGVSEGSGASIIVSPSSTTTYYVRAEGTCNTTTCVNVNITVNSLSTDPTGITVSVNPLCSGSSSNLTVTGGSLGTGATWQWYTTSCGTGGAGSGSPFSASPGSTTTYYVRAEGTCNTTSCVNTAITVIQNPSANAGSDGNECDLDHLLAAIPSIGTGTWTQASGPGASSFSNANDPNATVTATVYGTYTYTWTENNAGCTSADNVVIAYYLQPSSNAGNDATRCGALSTNLAAIPSAGTGTWAQVAGPGASGYSNPNASNATVTVTTWGVYTYSWSENNGGCTSSDQVVISFYQQPVANAGTATDQCDLDFTLNATPSVGTGTWTQFVGPGVSSFSNANDPNATVTVTQYGTYLFRWTEVNIGCSDFDDVSLTFYEAPVADAGPDETVCGLVYTMKAVYTVGSGTWSYLSGPGSASLSNVNSVNSALTVSSTGVYTFEWFIDNGGCQDRDTVMLNVSVSTPPSSNAGPDDSDCDLDLTFAAVPSIGTGTWSQVFGSGSSSFSDPNNPNATVTVTAYGTYVFKWTEALGSCGDNDDVTFNFFEIPLADAGVDDSLCSNAYNFNATGSPGNGVWTQIGGPGTSSFTNAGSPTTSVTVSATGIYTYEWGMNNNGCTSSDTAVIEFTGAATAIAGSDANECDLNVNLAAIPVSGTGQWSQVFGPGSTSFSDNTDPNSSATVTMYGTYIFRWTETTGACSSADDATVNFFSVPLADAGPDDSECSLSYTFNASLSAGSGTWSQVAGAGSTSFSNVNSPTATATATAGGAYTYEWLVNNNGCASSDTIIVNYSTPPSADGGPNGNECDLNSSFAAILSTGSGTWTQSSGPGTSSFSDPNDPAATVTVTAFGTYIYQWTETSGLCSDVDEVNVNFALQPLANGGSNGSSCTLIRSLNATPPTGTGTWSMTSGTGTSSFSNVNDPFAQVTVSQTGMYEFEWEVNNNGCISDDTVQIAFDSLPSADAGPGGSQCDLDFALNAVASFGNGTWSQVSGPGMTSFSAVNNPTTNVNVTAYGSYIYRWTEANGSCSDDDTLVVYFIQQPAPNAGADAQVCGLLHTLSAIPAVMGTGTWTQAIGPGTSAFANANNPNTIVTVDTYGIYNYRWTIDNNGCTAFDEITVVFFEPPVVSAGNDAMECTITHIFTAAISAGTGSWTLVSGPGSSSFVDFTDPGTTVTVSGPGTYLFQWSAVNGICSASDQVSVTFASQPIANAGNNNSTCGYTFALNATPPSGTGTWNQVSATGTSSFANANDPFTNVTVSLTGIYLFEWAVNNNGCVSTDTVQITFDTLGIANAGAGGDECDLDYTLGASTALGTGTWSQLAGPGISGFSNINDPVATVTVSGYGSYIFRWVDKNGSCESWDTLVVRFIQPPSVSAGSDQSVCGMTATFNGYSTPPNGIWSQAAGPGTTVFSNPNSPASGATASAYGAYSYVWISFNSICSAADTVSIDFFQAPAADAGSGSSVCGKTASLGANPSFGTGTWNQLFGSGVAAITNPSSALTPVTVSDYGTYVFQWTESNGVCTSTDTVMVAFTQTPYVDAGTDVSQCGYSYDLTGTVSAGTSAWSQVSGGGSSVFTDPADPTTNVTITTFGTYVFELMSSVNGCSDNDQVSVNFYAPVPTNAGADASSCGFTYSLQAQTSIGFGTWTQVSGAGTANFSNPNSSVSLVTVDTQGVYIFQWLETSGTCSDTDAVTITFYLVPVPDAGTGSSICGNSATLSAIPDLGGGTWTVAAGPGSAAFADPNASSTQVTVTVYGSYSFRWTENNGPCGGYDDVAFSFYMIPAPSAGADDVTCGLLYPLVASPSVVAGSWSQAGGPGTSVFYDYTSPISSVTASVSGAYFYAWTESNGPCTSSDTVAITFNDQPTANAGTDGSSCGLTFNINATGTGTSAYWTVQQGSGAVIANASSPSTSVTVSQPGFFMFRWQVSNTNCTDYDDVSVTFNPVPTAFAGVDATISLGNAVVLNGSSGDTIEWSPSTGLSSDNIPTPVATPVVNTTYTITVTNQYGCSDDDDVTITVVTDYNFTPVGVITPDGNGTNDTWIIDNIEFYKNCDVMVFNRYGNIVFRMTGYDNSWKGDYNGGPLPDGTYYYLITCPDNESVKRGVITILR